MTSFDLDAYLTRLGFVGERSPSLATLRALHALHPAAIPFENLDVLLETPISLDLHDIADKLVTRGRGGYCYEHNLLFGAALHALGFELTGLEARVTWNGQERLGERTHMLLRVLVEGRPYFADVGFGGILLTGPLSASTDQPQTTPHERFRLVPLAGDEYMLEAELQQAFRPVYRFDLQPQELVDYELGSYWVSNHPGSLLRRGLFVARVLPAVRYALHDNLLSVHRLGSSERGQRRVQSADELSTLLSSTFGIRLPETPQLTRLLAQIASRA
ncbi:MAG: nat [Myxococcaceae bacterium]|nr:nat [Myxococcaceae bacterium]